MGEYIERKKLKEALCPYSDTNYAQDMETILRIVDELPAADVAPVVHARWIHTNSLCDLFCEVWQCSCCSAEDENGVLYNFCPNCGAKMDLEELQ